MASLAFNVSDATSLATEVPGRREGTAGSAQRGAKVARRGEEALEEAAPGHGGHREGGRDGRVLSAGGQARRAEPVSALRLPKHCALPR